jgi:putative hydrolase of the HAD superfamily
MIRHVLLDADGVLQRHPVGILTAVERFVGERAAELFGTVTELEHTCLRGDGEFLPLLAAELERYDVPVQAAEVYTDVWLTIESVVGSVELVHALRDAGYAVHLGTNQQAGRAAYMRQELGYDDLFDESFYSCDLGAAKPEPAFFCRVLDRLGAAAPEVLFVDDAEANVVAARECGLAAEHWHLDQGMELLRDRLTGHGVALP